MAAARVTFGRRSRTPGTVVGVQVNTFGLDKLLLEVNGEALSEIAQGALQPAYEEAHANWAVLTGASRDSLAIQVVEVNTRLARVVLMAGGEKLINDPRNKSKKDYAPYLEFNGSPSGAQEPGVIQRAVYGNDRQIRSSIHVGVKLLIERLSRE